ncbi:MAG: tyrosine-type recombinase/integrase [Clostridia bacterium]|nr:tyrosine-type recombinase/integrase [Clostridia bacterium]
MPYEVSPAEFAPIVREFASYKLGIQGCSPKTVNEYLFDLRTFFRYLIAKEQDIPVESDLFTQIDVSGMDLARISAITTSQIYDFLMYTGNVRGNRWSAKARKLSAIKQLYNYLVNKRNYFEHNPAQNIESPKPKKTLPKVLSLEESLSLLEAVQNDTESPNRQRDFTMLTLFLNCGIRLSELVGINLNDIDPLLRSMRVVGKGSKERIVYLNGACRDALQMLLEERSSPKYANLPTRALFLSNRSQRISVKTVQHIVYKYLEMAGLEAKHYSVHKLRHTAATLMYQSGQVDVRVLKDILGHEQLNTTQIYTHISDANMEHAMDMNPLANRRSGNGAPAAEAQPLDDDASEE